MSDAPVGDDASRRVTQCEHCGQTVECENSVNPYNAEINHDYSTFWLCDGCFKQISSEI